MNNIKSAIQRLVWRIGNGKFEPNENDLNALKFIIDWINREKEELMNDNILFAKCYVRLLMYESTYYKDVKIASIQLNKVLMEKPIETFYDDFARKLNDLNYERFMSSKGLNIKHPAILTDDEKEIESKIIKENEEEFIKIAVEGKWTQDQVYRSLNNQITELIKFKK